jgi:hypothetical protein
MPLHSSDYQRGYDAGYKQALLDVIQLEKSKRERFERHKRDGTQVRLGGPNSPFKPSGVRGSIYNTPEDAILGG